MGLPDKSFARSEILVFPVLLIPKRSNVVGEIHLKTIRVGQERGRNVVMSAECFIEVWSAAVFVRLLEGVFVAQTVLSVPGKM